MESFLQHCYVCTYIVTCRVDPKYVARFPTIYVHKLFQRSVIPKFTYYPVKVYCTFVAESLAVLLFNVLPTDFATRENLGSETLCGGDHFIIWPHNGINYLKYIL